ncbi:zinc finger protein 184-like [Branchiostoma floridae]|uniref:Zinc finger protein 184-like n=1 Tax=Branchiostoma floridae TaxID=7739 RepID=A0A9J7HUD3_BRAFL|nr:zinc finger protein 184-like [Branchiostoma floridae]XP_035664597.1 zinc finger protein 184-like [Branchiostoma floridae]
MSRQQEIICGLSHEVTIAVLPRLNMEELMFELNRRIKNLDKENSIKDRLVSILRDVMLEEYLLLKRKAEVSMPGKEQETIIMQKNIPQAYAETMATKTSTPDASQQSSGLDIENSRENSNKVHNKELALNAVQVQLTATLPSFHGSPVQMNTVEHSCIEEEEDVAMITEDESHRGSHDELNMGTPTFSTQVLNAVNSTSNTYTEKPVEDDKPCEETVFASCEPTSDHTERHTCIKTECHVSEDDRISLPSSRSQNERYIYDRETGLINGEHEKSPKVNIEETPSASCKLTPDCKNSRIDISGFNTLKAQKHSKHRQRHKTGEKPFMCGECGYRASDRTRLVDHVRTHTGEKPFKCNQCHYQASLKSSLVKHMKKHSDEEPYRCELCEYKTYRVSHIERHMKYHAGVKPYKCEECGYRTADKGNLTKHMRCHTGERPYSCQECDYKASQRSSLVWHMRTKHQCK